MNKNNNKYKKHTPTTEQEEIRNDRFKITRSKIDEMYKDDITIKRNVNKNSTNSSSINTLNIDDLRTNYFSLTTELINQRKYANELYTFYPVYAGIVDYLSNMYLWRYTYIPRIVKERASNSDYTEIYQLMGEVIDGLSIETTFPMILTQLYIDGAVFLVTTKNTSSKTITTLSLPTRYCRVNAITQFGTYLYQFDFSYFDSLGLNQEELTRIFDFFPKEMYQMYNAYLNDKTNMRWQVLDGKTAAAIMLNKDGFPTKLNAIFSILQYDEYLANELEKNSQQLDKIIAHKIPTWEDRLIIDIDEMKDLHQGIAKVLSKNNHIKVATSFGDMEVLSIGNDNSKENKTLSNAYNAIYDSSGENNALFNSDSKESLTYGLQRDQSIVWKYIQQLVNFYNVSINNLYNFKGYQCDLNMLPISIYNENDKLMLYKEGATLGITKLEYIVATGIKQINLASKIELEDYLKLDKLKPLSTSYTQNDNSKKEEDNKEKEQEVIDNEKNTK